MALLELAAQRRDWNLGRAQGAGLMLGSYGKWLMCNDSIYIYVYMHVSIYLSIYLSDNVHTYIYI